MRGEKFVFGLHVDAAEFGAALQCADADFLHGGGDYEGLEFLTIIKSLVAYFFAGVWHVETSDVFAVGEGVFAHFGYAVWHGEPRQRLAMAECAVLDFLDTVRNVYRIEIETVEKCLFADARYFCRKDDAPNARTAAKTIVGDCRYGIYSVAESNGLWYSHIARHTRIRRRHLYGIFANHLISECPRLEGLRPHCRGNYH